MQNLEQTQSILKKPLSAHAEYLLKANAIGELFSLDDQEINIEEMFDLIANKSDQKDEIKNFFGLKGIYVIEELEHLSIEDISEKLVEIYTSQKNLVQNIIQDREK
jgi:hypothetical protein